MTNRTVRRAAAAASAIWAAAAVGNLILFNVAIGSGRDAGTAIFFSSVTVGLAAGALFLFVSTPQDDGTQRRSRGAFVAGVSLLTGAAVLVILIVISGLWG